MTGPLGPLDDDGVVDLLHAAGRGGPDATPADVTRAMTAGRKIRRRRQAIQVVGTGLAIAAVVAAGVTTVSSLDGGPGRQTVATAPDDTTPSPPPIRKHGFGQAELPTDPGQRAVYLGDALVEDLGQDWANASGEVVLNPNSELASRLPSTRYTAHAMSQVIGEPAFSQVCDARSGLIPCEQQQVADGRIAYLRHWADRDGSGDLRGESAGYLALEDGRYLLVVLSVDGHDVTEAQRDSHAATTNAWFDSLKDHLLTALTDARVEAASVAIADGSDSSAN